MNLDECSVYVFVRQDIGLAQQLVQSNHALLMMAWPPLPMCTMASGAAAAGIGWAGAGTITVSNDTPGHPNIILIGVPDVRALERVEAKLKRLEIVHYAWHEPDEPSLGFTAIATAALEESQRSQLRSYRLWKHSPSACPSDSGLNAEGGAKLALVAQTGCTEHRPTKPEVAGAIPAESSIPSDDVISSLPEVLAALDETANLALQSAEILAPTALEPYWRSTRTDLGRARRPVPQFMAPVDRELEAVKFLLKCAAMRTAPKTIHEIHGGSNQGIGNVCYLHPEAAGAVGLRAQEGVQIVPWRPGFTALVVVTKLMPEVGVIFAPLSQAVLDQFGLKTEDYPQWNHAGESVKIVQGK